MHIRMTSMIAAAALGLAVATPAAAEDGSAEDYKMLLTKQSLNLGKTRSILGGGSASLGTGRGLVLAPLQGEAEVAEVNEVADITETAYVNYTQLPEDMQLNIRIRFDFDSAALRGDQKPKLAAMCEAMRDVDIETFQIVGHTDTKGTASYNEQLSLLRAAEVKRHMVNDCGIAPERLQAVGVGEAFPADVANPEGEANRRVEFQALS